MINLSEISHEDKVLPTLAHVRGVGILWESKGPLMTVLTLRCQSLHHGDLLSPVALRDDLLTMACLKFYLYSII